MNNASNAAQRYVNSLQPATLAVDDINAHLHTFTQQQVQANVAQIAQNKSLSNCRSIIATYKNGYQQLDLTQQQFADSVKQGNTSLGKYLSTVKNGKASITGYVGYLLKAKAASIGLQMATMALKRKRVKQAAAFMGSLAHPQPPGNPKPPSEKRKRVKQAAAFMGSFFSTVNRGEL